MHIDFGSYLSRAVVIKLSHSKVNLVFSSDQHLSAVPLGRRADDYQAAVLSKLEFQGELAAKVKGVVLSGGDLFHFKKPRAAGNTTSLLEATSRTLRAFPFGKMWGAVGNHDIQFDRMDSLPNQPLGVLIAAGLYHDLTQSPVIFTNMDSSVRVLVESFPYMGEEDLISALVDLPPKPSNVQFRVALIHAYGDPNPTTATWGTSGIPYNPIGYGMLGHLDYDFVCWGHDHSRKGVTTVDGTTHIQLGSLARAAYNTDELDRDVALAIMSFADDGVRFVEKAVPVKPLAVVFTTADKPMDKVNKSDDVTEVFSDMDDAVEGIESNDPVEVMTQVCPAGEEEVLKEAIEICELK